GGHSILIKPSGGARTITSTATAIRLIFLNGADNVTIDGSLSGGTDRSLTLSLANSTTAGTTVIWVGSLGAGQGASNVTIRNCIIQNGTNFGSSTSANFGIFVGHANGSANGPDNDNLTIQNNLIQKTSIGIQAVGDTTGLNDNMLIADNTLGGTATADYLGRNGIVIGHTTNSTVTRNIVRNIANSTPTNLFGIVASTGTTNTSITRNSVSNMNASNSSGYGSNGITISTGSSSSNVTVANNFIYDLRGTSYMASILGDTIAGIRITGTTGGVNVWHNSVNLSGNYAGFNGATVTAAFMVNTTTATNLDVRNNIFANSFDNTTVTTDKNYAIYTNAAATMFSQINYNDYYVSGAQGVLGAINSTDRTTLSALQAATGQDLNSMDVDPSFTSSTDLHLLPLSLVNGMGTAISGVGIDYDNDARSATAPDIGADELVGSTGGVFPSGTFYNASVSSGDTFSGNVTVTGVLYISGPVDVGANTITLGCDANYSFVVGPPISYIIGNLAKQFCTTGAFTFPVGTADPLEYTPVDVNVTAIGVTPSTLTVSATDQAMTGLVPSRSISRYWSLTETGDITAFLTFNYLDNAGEDVPPTANESDFRIYRKSGSIITNLCPSSPCVNTTANSATTPTAVTDFSDWSIGEQVATSEPVNVSGRVITREGRPIARARVTVTNQEGETIITHTNHFGYYRFRELRSGQVYVFTVSHKLYRFSQPSQVRFISQDEDGIDFVADGMNEGVNPAETYFDRAPFDFDGDRKTDLSVWRAEEGAWYIRRSSDNKWQMQKFGLSTDEIAPADYDGDGRTDIAIFRASEGRWYVLMSESEELYVENFGRIGDLAMPSDYDGDGKADIAVWREEESSYYIRRSSDGKLIVQQIELKGKVRPVVGDVDGDGRADLGGYTTSGVLKIFLSRTGDTVTDTVEGGGTLILADFDGDARADKAVYLAKRGVWKVTTSGFTETVEAFAGGRASPGDYDGDGRVDVAVYLNGKWQMKQSASGIVRNNVFGLTTDIPIPSAYSR
ncbi:MAG: FG-GAP-like repeat-containing protein, partial [Acidobacteriota bacterium]|nr:FG-GAP-like repeat-containing protein [Acidobacteriota bacterium]